MVETQARIGTAIQVDGLTKRYGTQKAVDSLSLVVPEGSIFGLLGENGAGKTTTIQMLLGLVRPDAGNCRYLASTRCVRVLMCGDGRVTYQNRPCCMTG